MAHFVRLFGSAGPHALAAALWLLDPTVAFATVTWGVTDSLAKHLRTAEGTLPTALRAELFAARNEFESFQVLLRASPAETITQVSVSELTGPSTIPGTGAGGSVWVFRQGYITITQASADKSDGMLGHWPDPLIPLIDDVYGIARHSSLTVSEETTGLWVDVFVPAGIPPGHYRGTMTISFASATPQIEIPISLLVHSFSLPSTASLTTSYRLYYGALREGHGVFDARLLSAYVRLGLDHRISISNLDDGIADPAHVRDAYGGFVAGLPGSSRYSGASLTSLEALSSPSAWRATFGAEVEGRGLVLYEAPIPCDEPASSPQRDQDWRDCDSAAGANFQLAPSVPTLVTASIQQTMEADAQALFSLEHATILAPLMRSSLQHRDDFAHDYAAYLSVPGRRAWIYQSCDSHGCHRDYPPPPGESWPAYTIDSSITLNRAMPWIAFQLGASGEHYYSIAEAYAPSPGAQCSGDGPWSSVYCFSGNGDGTLVYPGVSARIGRLRTDGTPISPSTPALGPPSDTSGYFDVPIASVRLKSIRDGLEDYEYLLALRNDTGTNRARSLAITAYPSFSHAAVPADNIRRTRLAAARDIEGQRAMKVLFATILK